MKYFYLIFAASSVIVAIVSFIKGNDLNVNLCVLSALISLGIADVLRELKKSNKEVIIRDPKTGRFKKK